MRHARSQGSGLGAQGIFALAVMLPLTIGARAPGQSELNAVLHTAGDYIAQHEREVTAVSADEEYVQRTAIYEWLQPGVSGADDKLKVRRMLSHLVMIGDPNAGWVEFRDTFEVDGIPVRDRQERLVKLFLTPSPDQHAQAGRIADESARFNLNPPRITFPRTLNGPMTVLRFLRSSNQSRSTFELRSKERQNGRTILVVRFKEHAMPRLIGSDEGSAAAGSFWIDAQTGAVTETELAMVHQRVAAKLTVKYAEDATLKMWLPASMEEVYAFSNVISPLPDMFGKSTYANFKRFKVETATTVK